MPGPTNIPFGDPKAEKRWATQLFLDLNRKSYFDRKFINTTDNAVIQRLTDLESHAGDTINFDLSLHLRQRPTSGDNRAEGHEENLRFASDQIMIDQLRHPVSLGGAMTRKRTSHNMRQTGRDRLSDYWSKYLDEMMFIYLSGARGINLDFIEPVTYAGHAGNALQAPDAQHLLVPNGHAKATLVSTDKMTRGIIEQAGVKASMMQAENPDSVNMTPVMINGEPHYVCVMSDYQAYDLRVADTTGWLEVQKALATADGRQNAIFTGALGMIDNTVLHKHRSVVRFSDYGAGSDVAAGRALFMGRQAGVIAYGSTNGDRLTWKEIMKDYENEPAIAAGLVLGVKKTQFNGQDFGVISLDTAAANPNA